MTEIIITPEGASKMKSELSELKEKRKIIIERITRAKELGDLKENADYHDARDEQGFNEGKIQELEMLLRTATVTYATSGGDIVALGSIVTLNGGSAERSYTIVGSHEASPVDNKISIDSPLVKAMLGKKKGETFSFDAPSGAKEFTISSIK